MRTARAIAVLYAVSIVLSLLVLVSHANAATTQTYIVLYNSNSLSANAANAIANAGGSVVYSYPQIGVIIATSDNPSFNLNLKKKDGNVSGVAPTAGFGVTASSEPSIANNSAPIVPGTPAPGDDSLSGLQWDMIQIHSPEARAVNGGSPSIKVGVIDTGIDYTHPDLAPNIDFANSVSCVSGVPVTNPSAWTDDNGHGTHVAGIIAAARNGIGIVGVAPNVRLAAIKAGNASAFFFPEAVVCSYMWAGAHGIQVLNSSYFVDPWLFNCRNDPEQRAIWEAVRRAISFAMKNGAVVVGLTGNQADDLAHPTQDATSPDDTSPILRTIHNQCAVIPVEVPGVLGVSANGNLQLKSFYSSYGVGVTQIVAPGGDSILQLTPAAPNGRVLSTWPASLASECLRKVIDASGALYCYLQGTSVAAPHVSGVAALIMSTGVTSTGAVAARISSTADPIPCPPDLSIYSFFPSVDNGAPQVCQGGAGNNSFNGHGQVNALNAVLGKH